MFSAPFGRQKTALFSRPGSDGNCNSNRSSFHSGLHAQIGADLFGALADSRQPEVSKGLDPGGKPISVVTDAEFQFVIALGASDPESRSARVTHSIRNGLARYTQKLISDCSSNGPFNTRGFQNQFNRFAPDQFARRLAQADGEIPLDLS
jgi:hypothetical protein